MNPEEKLRLNITKKDSVNAEDVIKLFSLSLEATESVKKKLEEALESTKGTTSKEIKEALEGVRKIEDELNSLGQKMWDAENRISQDTDTAINKLYEEIKKVESQIPTIPDIPDLTSIEKKISNLESKVIPSFDAQPLKDRIAEVEAKIPEIKETTAEQTRDRLESLEGDDRLDAEAIKNIPQQIIISPTPPENPKKDDLWLKTR